MCKTKTDSQEHFIMAEFLLKEECEPCWTGLPKTIKRALCTAISVPYNKVHDPSFYNKLHQEWTRNKKNREMTRTTSQCISVECAICIDSYNLDGNDKITTLLCGHHFCSQCIFKHIQTRGFQASCPMCRSNVFQEHNTRSHDSQDFATDSERFEQMIVDNKRTRRRQERRIKRERRRVNNNIDA